LQATAPHWRRALSTGQHDLADKSFPEKSISYAHRCQRNGAAADIALARKPRITEKTTISAAAFMGSKIQLGDGPMNLPVELQRRFDQRWAARFGVPERGSRFFVTILAGRNLPKIQQSREPEPSTVNEKTIADFTRVVEQTGILHPQERYDSEVGSRTERTASNGTAREQAMKKISENPRFKEAPSSGTGYVIGGQKTTT